MKGIIGSATYGVAKSVNIYGIKVLQLNDKGLCVGDTSTIIKGIEHVVDDSADRDCPHGVVVNISIGGKFSQAYNDAAADLTNQGYFASVASGNESLDASTRSPASEPSVCTVGGTNPDDSFFDRSNYGTAVDVLAPAESFLSTLPGGKAVSYKTFISL